MLKQKNIAPGNENILPGKNIATNVSKIPTRSVLGIVNANCLPDKKASVSDFKKPSAPLQPVLKNTIRYCMLIALASIFPLSLFNNFKHIEYSSSYLLAQMVSKSIMVLSSTAT